MLRYCKVKLSSRPMWSDECRSLHAKSAILKMPNEDVIQFRVSVASIIYLWNVKIYQVNTKTIIISFSKRKNFFPNIYMYNQNELDTKVGICRMCHNTSNRSDSWNAGTRTKYIYSHISTLSPGNGSVTTLKDDNPQRTISRSCRLRIIHTN